MKLPKEIKNEIWEYCKANNITNVDEFITSMVTRGFTAEKFGSVPWEKPAKVKEVEKIVEKEVIKEVPVEVIKEVEKVVEKRVEVPVEVIKEVPVDKIVEKEVIKEIVVEKEVPVEVIKEVEKIVEKEVYVTDDETINNLQKELDETKNVLKDTIKEFDEERDINSEIQKENDVELETYNRKITDLTNEILQLKEELEGEKKNNSESLKEKDSEINNLNIKLNDTSKDDEINELKENLELFKNESKERGKIINELNNKIDELETIIKSNNGGNDIYGDNKKGLFGSNISDIWNRKK